MHIIAMWNTKSRNCPRLNKYPEPTQSSDTVPQHSSSPNLTRKVQNWRDLTYTDGTPNKTKKGKTPDQACTPLN
jgi:hypothetical protein